MTHQPIRIRAPLRSSLRLGRIPVHLDALLWHALFLKTGDPDAASERLPTLLAQDQGVYRASAMAFGIYPNQAPVIATQTATVGTMRKDTDLLPELMHPNGRKGKYSKLQVEGGPYKNRLTKYPTHHAPEVVWDAVGDGDAICHLLNFYVLAVGLEANRGFGAVGTFQWDAMNEDHSWRTAEGDLARVLPESIAAEVTGTTPDATRKLLSTLTPPYQRDNMTEPSVAPVRVRRIELTTPLLNQGA
ncbi:MAG: hypothetical protein AWU57_215 [Marinobacter sp. T13-3]|nr:MAG: hypothetical protein AWU57_215 [Marinobacter sp. T13-3]